MASNSNEKSGSYHHGDLAEALLEAVDQLARKFGLEAVTLRACAKLVGVAPSAGFRHYADKRALLTAFAARAHQRVANQMNQAAETAKIAGDPPFLAVALAYVSFALDEPAAFQVMWRSELIYTEDAAYHEASRGLAQLVRAGFAGTLADDDAESMSGEELLAWSAVHGLASLFADGPLFRGEDKSAKLAHAREALAAL